LEANRRYLISVATYHRMIDAGILTPADRLELIRGELIQKMPSGADHSGEVTHLINELILTFGRRTTVSCQNPLTLADSEPEPDLMLLRPGKSYRTQKPTPEEVMLLIEVSDSSLEEDRTVKLPLYAENGILEYWIVNLVENQIEVYRHPQANGTYAVSLILKPGDDVDLLAFPGVSIPVQTLFG
jgi:Uma2 family endonuclease